MQRSIERYSESDKNLIEKLGENLHDNYEFLLDEFSDCIVCRENDTIVGFITYSVIYERAEIIDIYVDDKYRRNKIGSILLEEVIRKIRNNNCENVTLEVNIENKNAIKFYESFGFKKEHIRKNYYKDSDAYLMKLDLR